LFILQGVLEIEVVKDVWIAEVAANGEGLRSTTGTPLRHHRITVQVVVVCYLCE
jgi:hypothetical protein